MKRKLGRLALSILLISLTFSLYSQNNLVDGVKDIDSLSKPEQVKALSKLCWENREKDSDKAIAYGLKGIKIAEKEGYNEDLGELYNFIGVIYQHYKDNVHQAIEYYNKGLQISLQTNDSTEIAYVYNNLGDAFYAVGNVPLALEYAEKSMSIFLRLNDKTGTAYSYINMGALNRIDEKYETALDYFNKAIILRKTLNDSIGIASAHLEIARTLFLMGRTDEAMQYFQKSLNEHKALNNKNYMAYSLEGIGEVFLNKKEFDSAQIFFNKSLQLSKERLNASLEIDNLLGIALIYAHTGNSRQGESILDQAMGKARNSKISKNILNVFKTKGEFYQELKEYKKASENYQDYIEIYDSLFSALQFQTMTEIKDRFQITEQLSNIDKDLRVKKKEQIYGIIIILLLLILAILLIFRYRTVARLSAELHQSNQAKDKIFSIISHDLISPFNVLIGTSELLLENLEQKEYDEALKNSSLIQKTSEESFSLISNLLNWARSQQSNIRINKERFDITGLMQRIKLMFDNQAVLKNINFQMVTNHQIFVDADQDMIQIVLVNLVNNAIKFTNPNGYIHLSAEIGNSFVKVTVKDNGIGISKQRVSLLFDQKSIESTKGTANEKGTGLGLILCKEFIEMHDGILNVNSEEGKGSEFYFTIPHKINN